MRLPESIPLDWRRLAAVIEVRREDLSTGAVAEQVVLALPCARKGLVDWLPMTQQAHPLAFKYFLFYFTHIRKCGTLYRVSINSCLGRL